MTIVFGNAALNAGARGVAAVFDGGTLEVYTSSLGALLLSYPLNTPAFALGGTPGREELQLPIGAASAAVAGTASDYLLKDSSSAVLITGTNEVTLTGGGGSLLLNAPALTFALGQNIEIESFFIAVS